MIITKSPFNSCNASFNFHQVILLERQEAVANLGTYINETLKLTKHIYELSSQLAKYALILIEFEMYQAKLYVCRIIA